MSTTINVTVGNAGLKEKAKQQTNANRQAKLEADARAEAKALGKEKRDIERAKQGLTPDGESLYGVPAKAPAKKEEPAATRLTNGYVLLQPIEAPDANQWFEPNEVAVIPLQKKGNYPLSVSSQTINQQNTLRPTYLSNGGPNYAPALRSDDGVDLRSNSLENRQISQLTTQIYFRLGETIQPLQPSPEVVVNIGPVQINFTLDAGVSISKRFGYTINQDGHPLTTVYSANVPVDSTGAPALSPGVWHHAALTVRQGTAYAFFNGQLLASVVLPSASINLTPTGQQVWMSIRFGADGGPGVIPLQPVYIHGLKFEERCRWTTSFAVPPSVV